jgi:phosphoribosyl 1,2-cyclic phosphodiesterase
VKIKCYGARGSIPVCGEEYVKYGGDTPCLEIRSRDDAIIIIDAGTGIRRLGTELLKQQEFAYNLLLTHSHWDHIIGFPFFKPIYETNTVIKLFGCSATQGNMKKLLSATMSAPFFPVPFDQMKAKILYSDICQFSYHISTIEIVPIKLNHPNGGQGYKLIEDGKVFVFLTDNELGYQHRSGLNFATYVDFVTAADLLIHDAEYTPQEYKLTRGWGHSTYLEALELAIQGKVKCFGLFHHNQERKDSDLDLMVQECREILHQKKVKMECFALSPLSELIL